MVSLASGERGATKMNGTLRKITGLAAIAATFGAFAATATTAGATTGACPARILKQAFLPFSDTGQYFLAPNGGFESGLTGWTSGGGATVVSGNETSYLNASTDSHSVNLPAGAWVKTGAICTNPNDQTVRLMV